MKFSARTQMLSDRHSVFESLRLIRGAGYDGVEISFEDIHFQLRPDLVEPEIIRLIREECARLELPISAVGNHMRYFFDDFVFGHIKREIAAAGRYGTDIFILSPMNSAEEKLHCRELKDIAVRRIGELCRVAEAEGVRIALEPEVLSVCSSTEDFLELKERVDSPALFMNFDAGHAFLTDPDITASIHSLEGMILHGHIEDMWRGEHLHLFPGHGDMDLPGVFRALGAIGFDGYLALDLYQYPYADIMADALKTLRTMDS